MCLEKPVCTPPQLSDVSLMCLKQFQCPSLLRWPFLVFPRKIIKRFLFPCLYPPGDWQYDSFGFVPTGIVSSFSTLQIFNPQLTAGTVVRVEATRQHNVAISDQLVLIHNAQQAPFQCWCDTMIHPKLAMLKTAGAICFPPGCWCDQTRCCSYQFSTKNPQHWRQQAPYSECWCNLAWCCSAAAVPVPSKIHNTKESWHHF